MKAYVGVTDGDWYRFLADRPDVREVNFWKPGGSTVFKALERGEPFLFKTHWPENRLVGGGYFETFRHLTISEAWDFFGPGNGCETFEEMRRRLLKYRTDRVDDDDDPVIGCVLLNEVSFIAPVAAPASFSKNTVQGKTYAVGVAEADPIVDFFVRDLAISSDSPSPKPGDVRTVDGPVFGEPRLVRPRLGQGGFKVLVRDAYETRCAMTGHKIVPTLQAAHIVPVSANGENRVDNGLLLRSDVHTMFDRGYLGVSPDYSLQVSPRLRSEFGNGDEFYARQGEVIRLPQAAVDRPNREFLEWHMDSVFKAS